MAKVTEVTLPDIGDFKDVEVIEVLVSPGDHIEAEDSLITLESDKASMEIPSPVAGTVKEMKVKVGDTINQGDPIALVEAQESAPAETAALQTRPPMDRALLERGKERYAIFCVPCHDPAGYGHGRIPSRGFPAPPSFHSERLRKVDPRHIVDVITDGYGVMYSYAGRVPPRDRWAIAAYVKALQLSQDAPERLLSAEDRQKLAEARP